MVASEALDGIWFQLLLICPEKQDHSRFSIHGEGSTRWPGKRQLESEADPDPSLRHGSGRA